jgi:hypothetical protein
MQPIRVAKNMYRGINAHLHSEWQAGGTWINFHNAHITDLSRAIAAKVVPLGYRVEIEASVQVRFLDDDVTHYRADLTVQPEPLDVLPSRRPRPRQQVDEEVLTTSESIALTRLIDFRDTEHPYPAISIRPSTGAGKDAPPVAWFELLSPSNKQRPRERQEYADKRAALLEAGVVFVEMDYLHLTPPTFARLPRYNPALPPGQPNGTPYRIVVCDPRPYLRRGQAWLEPFGVDDPLPMIYLPLSGKEKVKLHFGPAYHQTLNASYLAEQVDYAQFPVGWEYYTLADQARIAARMLAVIEAVGRGELPDSPPPTENLTLDDALARLAAHGLTVPEST